MKMQDLGNLKHQPWLEWNSEQKELNAARHESSAIEQDSR